MGEHNSTHDIMVGSGWRKDLGSFQSQPIAGIYLLMKCLA